MPEPCGGRVRCFEKCTKIPVVHNTARAIQPFARRPGTDIRNATKRDETQGATGLMNEDGIRVTKIDWMAAIPSLRLWEAISLAVSLRVMMPVALLMPVSGFFQSWGDSPFFVSDPDAAGNILGVQGLKLPVAFNESLFAAFHGHVSLNASDLVTSWLRTLFFGFCGVAAIRTAGCRFSTGTGPGIVASASHSLQSWKSIFNSTILCSILLMLSQGMFRVLCWTGGLTHTGITAAASLFHSIVCVVLGTGWLLSLGAIAIDRCDGAEALSRGICYVLSRWQRIIAYAGICCLILMLSDFAMLWLTRNSYQLFIEQVGNPDLLTGAETQNSLRRSLEFFRELFRLSLFFCEIAIVYVLLRNVEDGVSMQEIDGGTVTNA